MEIEGPAIGVIGTEGGDASLLDEIGGRLGGLCRRI